MLPRPQVSYHPSRKWAPSPPWPSLALLSLLLLCTTILDALPPSPSQLQSWRVTTGRRRWWRSKQPSLVAHHPIQWTKAVRGGATEERLSLDPSREVKLTITTAAGSKFLDRKIEVKVPLRTTVGKLKAMIEESFPGHPPRALQRLFYGTSKLRNKDPLTVVLKDSGVVILPIILDMVPPLRRLDYEGLQEVQEGLKAGTIYQQLTAYASSVVGLKHATAALTAHLHDLQHQQHGGNATEGSLDQHHEEEDDDDEELHTQDIKTEIAVLNDLLKADYHKVSKPPAPEPGGAGVLGLLKDYPNLEKGVRTVVRELDMDWFATFKAAFIAFVFGKFGAVGGGQIFLYLLVPGVFMVQLRQFRLWHKIVWEYLAVSKVNSGWLFGVISAPQQVLLTHDDDKWVKEMYGAGGKKGEASTEEAAAQVEEEEEEAEEEEEEAEEEEEEAEEEDEAEE